MYSRDISKKVLAGITTRSRQGKFFLPPLTTVGPDFDFYIARILEAVESLWKEPGRLFNKVVDSSIIVRGSVRKLGS